MMKFAITLLSFLTVAAFAATTKVDLDPGASATIHAGDETQVSCKHGAGPAFVAKYIVPANTETFSVVATCEHLKSSPGSTRPNYARAIGQLTCADKVYLLLEMPPGLLLGYYLRDDLIKLF